MLGIGLVAFALVWFQPQKLFIDDRIDEPAPVRGGVVKPAPGSPLEPNAEPGDAAPEVVAAGSFVSRDHGTSGAVRILDVGDGARIVRLENLDTSNGPDLYVYLSTNAAGGEEGSFDDDYVDLGRLKGNVGDQNYELPSGTELERYRSVVIWCDRFDSAFGAADLSPGAGGGT